MILWTLLAIGLYVALSVFVSLLSCGFARMLFVNVMPWFMLVCEVLLACCFGFARELRFLFYSKKRLGQCPLSELKNAVLFFDFSIKLNVLLSLFIVVVAAIPFMYGWMDGKDRWLMGYNLAAILEAPLYASFFVLVLLPLKSRVKNLQIDFMFETDEASGADDADVPIHGTDKAAVADGGERSEKSAGKVAVADNGDRSAGSPKNGTKKSGAVFRVAFLVVWSVISILVLLHSFTRLDESVKLGLPIDLPSIVYLVWAVLAALLVGGQFKNFGQAVAAVFTGKRLSPASSAKNIEAVSLVAGVLLASGILSTMIGFYAMFLYLEQKEWLAPNFYIAVLPTLYASFLAIVLECLVADLKRKSNGDAS